ncbi:hypothetical protein V496_06761 [Pseudogymnoascus sp. VKM F-4515 (FW-2607)]|nr:hypothetical protein V496_06761 [Pseudogymnoascus sp. VKM F-4515 (FW-2607)]KFY87370.1 hypothetical protein V498_07200 [Pseudogymnoascus sp. VKM F-4517 (FW-2822)]
MASSTQNTSVSNADLENLYHIVLTTSHIQKDPNSVIEKIRIAGTYCNPVTAKAAAHRCLFDAGYEREWFSQYEVDPAALESHRIHQRMGLVVFAVASDGTTFRISISTTPNIGHLTTDNEDGRIEADLYYVVQTNVNYANGDEGQDRDVTIEGIFTAYDKALTSAHSVLLSEENGITKKSFAEYDEAGDKEGDCGFGENVVVHAVGISGENYLISVIKGQTAESIKQAEAAARIR